MIILLFFSFLAGLVTVLSPCILPILPILLSASVAEGRYRSLGIILGVVASFSFFTLTLTTLVSLIGISPDILRYCAIGLIAFFGLTMLFPKLDNFFVKMLSGITRLGTSVQKQSYTIQTGFKSGFVLGVALGLIWTPCAGPILAAITTIVATHAITLTTIMITLMYSFGAAVPMFLISYGGNKIISSTQSIANYSEIIRKIFGILMIISALVLTFHGDSILQQLAFTYFPIIRIEDNKIVQKELETLKLSPFSSPISVGSEAPDLVGIDGWINSPPISLEALRGSVVLIDFWTYSCINCVRTLPYLKEWYSNYKDKGFVIIGVHTPEFEFEKSLRNVQGAVKRFELTYPIALDNSYKTWQAFHNHYWPAHYLIDQKGIIREIHFGEGAYRETENALRLLLNLEPLPEKVEPRSLQLITPETYLGYKRATAYQPEISLKTNQTAFYEYQKDLNTDHVGIKGSWLIGPEFIQSKSDAALLDLNFIANHVYLVMQSPTPQFVTVLLDDKPLPEYYYTKDMNTEGKINVNEPRMYDIIDLKNDYGRHKLSLQFPHNVSAFVFTFGAEKHVEK